MTKRRAALGLMNLFAIVLVAGCRTTGGGPSGRGMSPADQLQSARKLYDSGRPTKAMLACIDLTQRDPTLPGLEELKRDITRTLWEERAKTAAIRESTLDETMQTDTDMHKHIPSTYRLRRGVRGETGSLRTAPSAMERALQKPVTVHLEGVTLNEFVLQIGEDENINIIADNLDDAKTMTLHAENVPLQEILDYVSRNLGVTFSVGERMIWATPGSGTAETLPMETRIYRLRKGLSSDEIGAGPDGLGIIEAVRRFVPAADGSDLYFNDKAHVLIARNTRENLYRIEDLIESLDVSPPQVQIEARFVSTSITDLSELGIDWVLNSAVPVTQEKVIRHGSVLDANETQIDPSSEGTKTIGFSPFPNASSGLNLTYRGILTDPMFEAVIHALETSGRSRTLSVPKVTTVNNRPALIRIGEDFMYFQNYETNIERIDGGDDEDIVRPITSPSGNPTTEELGYQLDVTPSVGADLSSISLRLIPEITEFVEYQYWRVGTGETITEDINNASSTTDVELLKPIKLPIFRKSRIETEVVVQSGETVVMGGLITSTESDNQQGVPILSSLPIIGHLFRHDSTDVSEKNLLIFVTATILSERGETLVPIADVPDVSAR